MYQVGAVLAFARSHGTRLVHVKPHGALYNQAAGDDGAGPGHRARAWRGSRASSCWWGPPRRQAMRGAAQAEGLRFAAEAFADRAYARDGTLVPRGRPGAVITDAGRGRGAGREHRARGADRDRGRLL